MLTESRVQKIERDTEIDQRIAQIRHLDRGGGTIRALLRESVPGNESLPLHDLLLLALPVETAPIRVYARFAASRYEAEPDTQSLEEKIGAINWFAENVIHKTC